MSGMTGWGLGPLSAGYSGEFGSMVNTDWNCMVIENFSFVQTCFIIFSTRAGTFVFSFLRALM